MGWRDWTGVGERRWKTAPNEQVQPGKTLWDWLQLLIVPAILIGVTLAWSATQTSSDNKREDRRIAADRAAAEEARQDATLRAYLGQMSELLLHENLVNPKGLASAPARTVARSVTVVTLRRLGSERAADVLKFLAEAGLLTGRDGVLAEADLRGADFTRAPLTSANLKGANLRGAKLSGARLGAADLRETDLRRADLRAANLEDAGLISADLRGAYLSGASLSIATITDADLSGADLRLANLEFADFSGATLKGANFEGARLGGPPTTAPAAEFSDSDLTGAKNLDLSKLFSIMDPGERRAFLHSQKGFLDSLSPAELAKFNLTPEKLAKFRREANGD
jgi:uncharacterized protein YjbI with pentapeptide repeats